VSRYASTEVSVDCPRVCLKKLSGGVDFLVMRLALNCWEYWVSKACHDVLNSGVLHLDVLVGPECLFALLVRKRFWTGVPKKTQVLSEGYSLG
jgi:hypothetical protein